ncbi:MAG: hypothetical protein NTV54_01055 [Ignavibacteriales bacterium]|nr:hypothetical protein [Ignavibacteriales bacterium]
MPWRLVNPDGKYRVIVTKELPGEKWLSLLIAAGCRVEICDSQIILTPAEVQRAIGKSCTAAVAQLSEQWGSSIIESLANAGGKILSTYAVGYNNIDVASATRGGIAVGNTPGVLTDATAEVAVALTFAAARRVGRRVGYIYPQRIISWMASVALSW